MAVLKILITISAATCCLGSGSGSWMRRASPRKTKSTLQTALQRVLNDVKAERLFEVESSIRQTFEAIPTNKHGRIPYLDVLPAIVRDYFARDHGWLIKGLEPPVMKGRITQVHETSILKEKTPDVVKALLEPEMREQGLALSDVVATVAVLEHLILEANLPLLVNAYYLNEKSVKESITAEDLSEVLTSYLLLFRGGNDPKRNLEDIQRHQRMKLRAKRDNSVYKQLVAFEEDSISRSGKKKLYKFNEVEDIVRVLGRRYGQYQNDECLQMKHNIMSLDADGSGAIPFKDFSSQPNKTTYAFTETLDYLRDVGAVDDRQKDDPKVFAVNYLLAPSNCIATSGYNAVCCLNECGGIVSTIESRVRSPTSPVQQLLEVVNEITTTTVNAPRNLPSTIASSLSDAASQEDGGEVPIHSSGFMQWLHSAFPHECPNPTAQESAAEDSEHAAVHEWENLWQLCTRVPEWQNDEIFDL